MLFCGNVLIVFRAISSSLEKKEKRYQNVSVKKIVFLESVLDGKIKDTNNEYQAYALIYSIYSLLLSLAK